MSELPDINIPISRVEIVRKAIHFKKPPRLPVMFEDLGITDVASYSLRPKIDRERMFRREPFTDEWGCRWEFTEMANMGQVKFHPLEDLDDMDSFSWPDYEDISRYEWILEDIFTQGDRYVRTGIFMILFERMHTLHGFEQTLQDLYLNRKRMEKLADHIVEVHCGIIENAANHFGDRTHAIHMTEDWGTQQATFISPELFRDFFKPRYRKMFDAMHLHGYDVWIHSCGKVNDFVEEFIDVGVDVINLQQPRALGIEEMGTLMSRLPPDVVMAASEYGFIGSEHPDIAIIDLVGLQDRYIAHNGFSADYLFAREPDIIWFPHADYSYTVKEIINSDTFALNYDYYPGAYDYGIAIRRTSALFPAIQKVVREEFARVYRGCEILDYKAKPVSPPDRK